MCEKTKSSRGDQRKSWFPHSEWKDWEESFKTSYREYVDNQYEKDMAVQAVHDAVGRIENVQKLALPWLNSMKVHAAALPLAEFTGVIGNLRGARFGRDSAWRTMATFGALDEYRHTQIPLLLFHPLLRLTPSSIRAPVSTPTIGSQLPRDTSSMS